jgi:hypothetical protein
MLQGGKDHRWMVGHVLYGDVIKVGNQLKTIDSFRQQMIAFYFEITSLLNDSNNIQLFVGMHNRFCFAPLYWTVTLVSYRWQTLRRRYPIAYNGCVVDIS